MKKYFYSGTAQAVDGRTTHAWGIVEVEDERDPCELAKEIAKGRAEKIGVDTFVLNAFNRID